MASQHICKKTIKLLKSLDKQGCRIDYRGQQMMVYAPDGVNKMMIHMSKNGKSYHPLRRWAKNLGFKT